MAKKESYKSKKEVEALKLSDLKTASTSELRAIARTQRKILESNRKAKAKAGIITKAPPAANKKDTREQIIRKIAAMKEQIDKPTATVKGWRKEVSKGIGKALGKETKWTASGDMVIDGEKIPKEDIGAFWNAFHQLEEQTGAAGVNYRSLSSDIVSAYRDAKDQNKDFRVLLQERTTEILKKYTPEEDDELPPGW